MIRIFLFAFALFLGLAAAKLLPGESQFSHNGHNYVYFDTSVAVTREHAAALCNSANSHLADIADMDEFDYLAGVVKIPAWINSLGGKTFGDRCIAFFPGGAIAVPVGGCNSLQAVLCED